MRYQNVKSHTIKFNDIKKIFFKNEAQPPPKTLANLGSPTVAWQNWIIKGLEKYESKYEIVSDMTAENKIIYS